MDKEVLIMEVKRKRVEGGKQVVETGGRPTMGLSLSENMGSKNGLSAGTGGQAHWAL